MFIKCLTNCARCDWSVRVHYSSIKHAAYVTRVLYRVIMRAAYVTGLSARNFLSILYKRKKKLHPRALLSELYKYLRIFKNTREALGCASLVFLKILACLSNSTMHSDAIFMSLIIDTTKIRN